MMPDKMMAFWRYESFPFVLCGKIVKMKGDGKVETEEYGPGFWFKPIKIVPYDEGLMIKNRLKKLTQRYHTELDKFKDGFNQAAKTIIGE
jgi:hypothetical protein